MTMIVLERNFDPLLTREEFTDSLAEALACFERHRVVWAASYLSADGRKLVCTFQAPDMESARLALRESNADLRVLWRGSMHDAPDTDLIAICRANVLVERAFDDSISLQEIQDIEDAGIGCLKIRDVRFHRTFFSEDCKRMLCLYEAPDAESVRQAQLEAGVPFSQAWACSRIGPEADHDLSS